MANSIRVGHGTSTDGECSGKSPWSVKTRLFASALILLHVTAVFWPPFTAATQTDNGSSPFAEGIMAWLRPYTSFMYLDHGYAFFAPNPGPCHLVHYKVEFADGRPPVEGVFPNLKEEQPRLFYHRHFMLSEELQKAFIPPEPPESQPLPSNVTQSARREMEMAEQRELAEQKSIWKHRRERYEQLRKSMEDHLLAKHGGSKVTLTRRQHRLLVPSEFLLKGERLDLPETYIDLPEARLTEVIR